MNNKKTSYKLLSLDLDGTLLSPILRKAKQADCLAIQDYMSCGGMPFINTGRAPWAIVKTFNRVNKAGSNQIKLLSCWNGAYLRDFNDGEIIETKISHEYCKKIFEIAKKFKGVNLWFYLPKGMEEHALYAYPSNPIFKIFYRLSKVRDLTDRSDLASFKIDIFSTKKSVIARVYHELIKNNLNQIVTLTHSSPRLIEVTPRGINKGSAIQYFAKKYNINKSEIVSMGDSFNDLSAFKNSAMSIGINPSNSNLLEHCDAIIKHKTRGVAEAINTYVLKDVDNITYKLIYSDLDGTLIDGRTKLFSNEAKFALQQCTNHLIPIAIASGRGIYDGMSIVKSMELNPKNNIYIIGNNGATIYDIYTKQYISQSPIDNNDAKRIFEILKQFTKDVDGKMGFIIHQHSTDLLFYNEQFWKPINFKKTGFEDQYDPWASNKPIYVTEYPEDIICYKFVIKFPDNAQAVKGVEALKQALPNLEICFSSDVNVEINKKGVNKGFAAKKLSSIIGVSLDNVLVMGDGQNDIPALKLCKNSFAPSYAPDFVKKEANNIIDNVTVSTFAKTVIDNYVFKGNGK